VFYNKNPMKDNKLLRLNVKIHNTFFTRALRSTARKKHCYLHSLCVFSIEIQIVCITVKRLVDLSTVTLETEIKRFR